MTRKLFKCYTPVTLLLWGLFASIGMAQTWQQVVVVNNTCDTMTVASVGGGEDCYHTHTAQTWTGSLAPGASTPAIGTFNWGDHSKMVAILSGGGSNVCAAVAVAGGHAYTYTIPVGTCTPPCTCTNVGDTQCDPVDIIISIKNNGATTRAFQIQQVDDASKGCDASVVGPIEASWAAINAWVPNEQTSSGNWPSFAILKPGATGDMHVRVCNTNVMPNEIMGEATYETSADGMLVKPKPNTTSYLRCMSSSEYSQTNMPPGASGSPTPKPAGSSGTPTTGGYNSGTNGINWSMNGGGSTNTTDTILKDGFGALYNQQSAMLGKMDMMGDVLKAIRDALAGNTNGLDSDMLESIAESGINTTNLLTGLSGKMSSATNLLSSLVSQGNWLSNTITGASNAPSALMTISNGIVNAAENAADLLDTSGAAAAINGAKSSFAEMPGMTGEDARNIEGETISLGVINGQTMSMILNPFEGEWGDAWYWLKEFARWFLVAAYLIAICRDTYKMSDAIGNYKQLQIPVINGTFLGVGGNWGALLYPVLLAGMMLAFGVVLAAMATVITDSAPLIGVFTSDPTSGATGTVGRGFSWLKAAFPLDTMFSLAGAYCVWRLTMTYALAVFAVTIRALAG